MHTRLQVLQRPEVLGPSGARVTGSCESVNKWWELNLHVLLTTEPPLQALDTISKKEKNRASEMAG